jgi:chromosome segregation ATPase
MSEAPEAAQEGVEEALQEVDAGVSESSAELAELRAAKTELEKRNAYLQRENVKARTHNWAAEHQRREPALAVLLGKENIASIVADSREDFARKIEALKVQHAPYLNRIGAMQQELAAAKEAAQEAGFAAGREAAVEAWGRPASDQIGPPSKSDKDERADTLRKLAH